MSETVIKIGDNNDTVSIDGVEYKKAYRPGENDNNKKFFITPNDNEGWPCYKCGKLNNRGWVFGSDYEPLGAMTGAKWTCEKCGARNMVMIKIKEVE